MQDAGDPRRVVRRVRLKFACAQRLLKRLLPVHQAVNRVRLVSVCDNRFISQDADRGVDD